MLLLTTFVLAGSVLAASTLAGKTMRRRKSTCRTWLAASQRDCDRGKRTPGSLLRDGLQKTLEPLFGQTHSRQLRARRSGAGAEATRVLEQTAYRELGLSLLTLVGAAVGVVLYYPILLLTIPVVVYLWRDAFTGAYRALCKGHRVTVDVLYVLTTILAITSGYLFLLTFVAALYCGSRVLLIKNQEHAQSNVARTFGLDQRQVWLVQDEVEVAMPLAQVEVGDMVVVHAGDPIPVDGYVTEGAAFVDQQRLTGEAYPVEKTAGDYVLAATVLLTGKLYIRVDKTDRETTAGHMANMLHQTVDSRAIAGSHGHVLTERLALPVLLLGGLALLTVGPPGAMAVLNAALFMSLQIVGPLCMLAYLQRTAQHHVFVKDGRALEQLAHADTVVFDKTGAVTRDQLSVGQVHTCGEDEAATLLAYAAAAADGQPPPIAHALRAAARAHQLRLPTMQQAESTVGEGISGVIEGATVHVGSLRFMAMEDISLPPDLHRVVRHAHNEGHAVVLVARHRRLVGAIELQATIRAEAQRVIAQLRRRGITTFYIISGDHETPTQRLAQAVGVDRYFADTLPQDKAVIIEQLQAQGHVVCYVGDGINDALACQQAQVSVSLRGASTTATDMAHVVVLDEGLGHLGDLFAIAADFNKTLTTSCVLAIVPGVINIVGAFFLHFSFLHSVLCSQAGLWASVGNALWPLLKTSGAHSDGPTHSKRPRTNAPRWVQRRKAQ